MKIKNIHLLALGLLLSTLTACGGGGSSGGTSPTYSCTLPCLDSTPLLDTTAVSSASGGTVKITFTLKGDITNVNNVEVFLATTDITSPNPAAGWGTLIAPIQATNTIDIVVNAGGTVATGSYYPWILITANSPSNSGNQYFINPYMSGSKYIYAEVVGGASPTPALTGFTIPTIQITP